MKHISDLNIIQNVPSVVTLGNFDGLHLGHRKLIRTVGEIAKNNHAQSIVFSFYPHPQIILNKNNFPGIIFSRCEKKKRLEQMGVDLYIEYPFTKEFANITAEKFVEDILIGQLRTQVIVIGSNNRFGRKQEGDLRFLRERQEKWGISVVEISPVLYHNERVSSTRARENLMDGNIQKVNELLEVPYGIIGNVVEGKKLGHALGYPTVNISSQAERLYPPNGVYITRTKWDKHVFHSVTNIGYNPTVNGNKKMIETYIIDFDRNIYGETVEVEFCKWLRQEQKFLNLEELIKQMGRDVDSAKSYFNIV